MSAAVEISCKRWAALNVSTVQQAEGLMKAAPVEVLEANPLDPRRASPRGVEE